jgi:hypothetical protein
MNKRGYLDMAKWFAYQAGFAALAYFGYIAEIPWCENVFMFFTWGKGILSIFITIIMFILKGAICDGSHGATKTIEFHNQIKDKIRMPAIIPIIINALMISFLAGLGHFVLATVWFVIALCNSMCLSLLKDVAAEAKGFVERTHARERVNRVRNEPRIDEMTGQMIPNPDADVFTNDDNDLFRMGITTTEREE